MAKIVILLVFGLAGISLAVPDSEINYQGKLTDDDNVAVADGNYNFKLVIYDSASGGNCLWTARGTCGTPTAKSVALENGIFSTKLGESGDNALNLDFNSNYYLGVTIGSDTEMLPRKKIGAVGFAMNAGKLDGLSASESGTDAHIVKTDSSGNLTASANFNIGNSLTLSQGASNRLDLASGDSLNLVSGAFQIAGTEVISSGRIIKAADGTVGAPAFSFSADTNTGMYRGGTDILRFTTAGVDRMTILANGNVGIGTTSPGAKLDVYGSGRFGTLTANSAVIVNDVSNAGSPQISLSDNTGGDNFWAIGADDTDVSYLKFAVKTSGGVPIINANTSSEVKMTIKHDGNIGIGTVNPLQKLQVAGDINIESGSGIRINNTAVSGNVLRGDGTRFVSATLAGSDITGSALTKTDDTNVTLTLGGTPSTALLRASSLTLGWTGQLSPARGGTGIASYTVGDLIYASGTTTLSKLADVATGNSLISGGVGVAPTWGKIGLTTHVSGTLPIANGGTNATTVGSAGSVAYSNGSAYAFNTAGTAGQALLSGGTGAPTYGTVGLTYGGTNANLSGVATGGIIYKGASALAGTGALTGVLKGNGASAPSAMTGTANYVTRWTDANTLGNSIIFDNGTNVGIGTATPAYKLDISASANDYLQRIYNTNTGTSAGGLYIRSDGSGNLLTLNSGGTDIVTISSAQTVFNNPTTFTSAGDVSLAYDLFFTNSSASYVRYQGPGYIQTESPYQNLNLTLSAANLGEVIIDDDIQITGSRLHVNSAGNVGIGTTSPGHKLDVSGGSIRTTNQFISTLATGTAPLAVTSTTLNTNLNADLLDGYNTSMTAGNSTVVVRNASGYVLANYFNTTADVTATTASHFAIQTGSDNYIRWQTPANARTSLGLTAGGAGDIWVEKAGDTMTGDLTVGSTSRSANTYIRALAGDSYNAGFEAYGNSQGTGYTFVGQSNTYGGGMFYNGDGAPAFATGEAADRISFYRMNNGTKEVAFSYPHDSNLVTFRGGITLNGTLTTGNNAIDGTNYDISAAGAYTGVSIDVSGNSEANQFLINGTAVITSGRVAQNLTGITSSGTITLSGLGAGTDNSVVILNSSNQLTTDEIDSRVWGTSLTDGSGTASYVARWSDSNTLTTGVLYDNGTNVGIGTASPTSLLDIQTTSSQSTPLLNIETSSTVTDGIVARFKRSAAYDSKIALSSNGANTGILFEHSGGTNWELFSQNSDSTFRLRNSSLTPVLTVDQSGKVGIGTTSPGYVLDVNGHIRGRGGSFDLTNQTGANNINLGVGVTSNQYAMVDLIGDTTYTDYGLRLIRYNTGANSQSEIRHRGTGTLYMITNESAPIQFWTNNTAKMTIAANGNVGIGTTSPSKKLDIVGSGINLENTTTSSTGIIFKNGANFIHNFQHPTGGGAVPTGLNTFLGENSGNFTMGSTATQTWHSSWNTGVGVYSLSDNNTGYQNAAFGAFALQVNTSGNRNSALGYRAGRFIAGGATGNLTSNTSLYLGAETKASADGNTNEIVIGYDATGLGSNTAVLGNSSITTTALRGNVGIGTTSPGYTLDVNGSIVTRSGVLDIKNTSSTNRIEMGNGVTSSQYAYIDMTGDTTYTDFGLRIIRNNGGANTASDIIHRGTGALRMVATDAGNINFSTTNTERMRIASNGYVGIGTSSPANILHIDDNAATGTGLKITGGGGGANMATFIRDVGGTGTVGISASGSNPQTYFTSSSNTFSLGVSGNNFIISDNGSIGTNNFFLIDGAASRVDVGAGDTSITIDSGGLVGIGDTTPSYLLDVYANVASNYSASFTNDGDNANRHGIRIQAGADNGSGTTYYLNALDGDGGQVGYIANVSGTFALTDVSDVSTKTNIVDTDISGADIINGLRVVNFNRVQNPNGPVIRGFVAQEVETVYPEAVTVGPDGKLGLVKDQFTPVIIKALQEIFAKSDIQETEIEKTKEDLMNIFDENSSTDEKIELLGLNYQSMEENISNLEELNAQTWQLAFSNQDKIISLEEQIEELKGQHQLVFDFATALGWDEAVDSFNLNLGAQGKLVADGIVAGAFTVRVEDEDRKTIGSNYIEIKDDPLADPGQGNDGKSYFVKTSAITESCVILTSFQANPNSYSWVEKVKDELTGEYIGFKINLSTETTERIYFDWWIVEKDEKTASPLIEESAD